MDAKAHRLHEVLEGEKQYIVPVFQRYYTWKKANWQTLWEDLEDLEREEESAQHFMGAFVCIAGSHSPASVPDYILVDGQQRIVTLTIILAVLRDLARKGGEDELADEIQNKYLVDKYKKGIERYKVLSRHRDRKSLMALVDGQELENRNNIVAAHRHFLSAAREFSGGNVDKIRRMFAIVTKQLSLVMITLENKENPFTIFEKLNDTGQNLTESDLIRNYVFMKVPLDEQETFDDTRWKPFEDMFLGTPNHSSLSLTSFYRNALMRNGSYVPSKQVYSSFKEYAEKLGPNEIVDELENVADIYIRIRRPDMEEEHDISEVLQRISLLDVGTAYPLLLFLYERFESSELSRQDFVSSMKAIESFVLRRSICEESTRGYNYLFPRAIRRMKASHNLHDALAEFLQEYGWPDDERFTEALIHFEIYRREKKKCRLILEEVEKYYGQKERVSTETLTIEHIMPQTLTDDWKEMIGERCEEIHERHLDTMGNLTLTGYNSELGNRSYQEKQQMLVESNISMNRRLDEIGIWDAEAIRQRARELAHVIVKIWPAPSQGGLTSSQR